MTTLDTNNIPKWLVIMTRDIMKCESDHHSIIAKANSVTSVESARTRMSSYYTDEFFNTPTPYEVEEELVTNDGFEIEILGGVTPYNTHKADDTVKCKITKDGKTYIVGFNRDGIIDIIRERTIIQGKVQGQFKLALKDGCIYAVLNNNVIEHEKRKSIPKTSVFVPGRVYAINHLFKSEVYVGNLYTHILPHSGSYNSAWCYNYKFYKEAKPLYLFINYSDVMEYRAMPGVGQNIKLSDVLNDIIDRKTKIQSHDVTCGYKLLTSDTLRVNRTPRIETDEIIEVGDIDKALDKLIKTTRSDMIKLAQDAKGYIAPIIRSLSVTTENAAIESIDEIIPSKILEKSKDIINIEI